MAHRLTSPALAAAGVFGAVLGVYLATLSPTINSFDSAEFTTAAADLGIVHATGYPLYLSLAHLVTRIPVATLPVRVNAFSAGCAAGAAGVIVLPAYRLSHDLPAAAVSGLALGLSGLLWSQAVIAEVYALEALLTAALLHFAVHWWQTDEQRSLVGLMLLFGLSLTNHLASVLLGPGLLVLVVWGIKQQKTSLRWVAAAALTGLLPLTLYAKLPMRFAANPALNYVGTYFPHIDLTTPGGIVWMVSGRMFASEMFGVPLAVALRNVLAVLGGFWLEMLGIGLLLMIAGGLRLWQRDRWIVIFVGLGAALIVVFFSTYDVIDAAVMTLPALVLTAPLLAVGLNQLRLESLPAVVRRFGVPAVGMLLVATHLIVNGPFASRRGDTAAYDYAQTVMHSVEHNAFVLTFWTTATPLEYLQIVEGIRADVTIFDRGLYVLGVRDQLLRTGIREDLPDRMTAALHAEIRIAAEHRPVYITENDPAVSEELCLTPVTGVPVVLYRVWLDRPPGQTCEQP
ncbi:MAG: protein O-mannosyl-transferase family [Anaerolineae bacterium]